ncbi:hypothetical protein FSP39_020831 [Pinctada imbricata]|uniref:G-protein coupled receptors family 1 profile domain-containing protein n=1 Tax=Pinctada imbricata TaxID=66713 RepID=A0AA88XTN9_PINIB|nr:hypothetical protein FSP39_020831 [Pinctada imbricata]
MANSSSVQTQEMNQTLEEGLDSQSQLWEGELYLLDILTLIIAGTGVSANGIVIYLFLRFKKLRKPIIIGIGMLALSDMTSLSTQLLRRLQNYGVHSTTLWDCIETILLTAYFTSVCHVILLSLQQYLYIGFPLQSTVWFTIKRMSLISLSAWLLSFSMAFIYMSVLLFFKEQIPKTHRDIYLRIITLLSTLVPVLCLGILFFLKRRALKHSLIDRRSTAMKKMSRLVGFVVTVYLVTTTPMNIRDIMDYSFGFRPTTRWRTAFNHTCFMLLLCNYTINPFLYFILTPKFREFCCRGRRKPVPMSSGTREEILTTDCQTPL